MRGLLFSEQNRAFTPGYTQKDTKFYRYYINTDAIKLGKTGCKIQRLLAGEIETVVVEKLRHVLRAPEVLAHAVREISDLRSKIKESECIRALQSIDPVWDELFPSEQANIVRTLVERITVRREGITIQWRDQCMNNLLRETLSAPAMVNPPQQ
ncbi:MAG: Resolvase [Comamonadaceae bacterium]|nr:MAG: Resolvase [Comamonadaceae bacterium]